MFHKIRHKPLHPRDWGFGVSHKNVLMIGSCSTVDLAKHYGTPLHVVDEEKIQKNSKDFLDTVKSIYPADVNAFYAFKCNSVPGIISLIKDTDLGAEVVSEIELQLAIDLGYIGEQIIVNGPFKSRQFLIDCLRSKVRYIIIDSLEELRTLVLVCRQLHLQAQILLRINPDFIPKGMNQGSATGSRRGCAFGLDWKGGEVEAAFILIKSCALLSFQGFHIHIGTGICRTKDYTLALKSLKKLVDRTLKLGFKIAAFDVGGGLGIPTSREMTTMEMLAYQTMGRLPNGIPQKRDLSFKSYAEAITKGMNDLFGNDLPELLLEPGRCIVSSSQILLLGVHQIKERNGIKKWVITDGGLGTITKPTYYEYHEIFLCNDIFRPKKEKVTIIGPVCFASDIVYRNKYMAQILPGEILAVMDSGAYFTAWESSFGFAKPAVVAVKAGTHRILRRKEIYADVVQRDMKT